MQKAIRTTISAAEGALATFNHVTSIGNNLSEAMVMPLLEKLAVFKGVAILPVAKQTDPVMGIDVHMVTIPPSPASVPMPHPYIGMMFKAADFAATALATVLPTPDLAEPLEDDATEEQIGAANTQDAKALGHQLATIAIGMLGATVKIGGFLPRVTASTPSKAIPHFPMGAGFHPVYSRMVTKNHGHALLGSLFVVADGMPLTGGTPHLHNDCWDIGVFTPHDVSNKAIGMKLFIPSGMIMPIPSGKPVLTNLVPSPINPLFVMKSLFKGGFAKLKRKNKSCNRVSRKLHRLNNKFGGNKLVRKAIQTYVGHPIDVAGGFLFTDEEDFFLPGQIPLAFERIWYSSSEYNGPLGSGWHHSLDWGIKIDPETRFANVRMGDGRAALFDTIPIESIDEPRYNRTEKMFLNKHQDGFYYVKDQNGLLYNFSKTAYPARQNDYLLTSIANTNGFAIRLKYDALGNLIEIIDSANRVLVCTNNANGQLEKIETQNPRNVNEKAVLAAYTYDEEDDLIQHKNAEGYSMFFEYENHLLHKEIWRNGAVFHFRYDGTKIGAKCIETWGDGRLLHYTLDYQENTTIATDSLGNVTTYHHRNGIVIEKVDPKGGIHKSVFNSFDELEYEINALDQIKGQTHDAYGNVITATDTDGATVLFEYFDGSNPFLLTEATDATGGKWIWEYDEAGNLAMKQNPAGAKTHYAYEDGLLYKITNTEDAVTHFEHDEYAQISRITYPNSTTEEIKHDYFGNSILQKDVKGNEISRKFDKLNRAIEVRLPDGNLQKMTYDALDNVIFYKDQQQQIEMRYNAMGKLCTRTQNKATLEFKYDTEGQLRNVINEKEEFYTFVYDGNGEVVQETSFDGITNTYQRNSIGWVEKQTKNKQHTIIYEHDEAGRVLKKTYNDGFVECFEYKNGQLILGANPNSSVAFAYDKAGNIATEKCNEGTVESEYTKLGRRSGLTSSMGAVINMEYNLMGDIVTHQASGWESKTIHDEFGLAIEQHLPGNINSKWERDNIGRIKRHRVATNKATKIQRTYYWGVNNRLKQIEDNSTGLSVFEYDGWGNLSKSQYQGGVAQLRNPDEVGNLFETSNRTDRTYGTGANSSHIDHPIPV